MNIKTSVYDLLIALTKGKKTIAELRKVCTANSNETAWVIIDGDIADPEGAEGIIQRFVNAGYITRLRYYIQDKYIELLVTDPDDIIQPPLDGKMETLRSWIASFDAVVSKPKHYLPTPVERQILIPGHGEKVTVKGYDLSRFNVYAYDRTGNLDKHTAFDTGQRLAKTTGCIFEHIGSFIAVDGTLFSYVFRGNKISKESIKKHFKDAGFEVTVDDLGLDFVFHVLGKEIVFGSF